MQREKNYLNRNLVDFIQHINTRNIDPTMKYAIIKLSLSSFINRRNVKSIWHSSIRHKILNYIQGRAEVGAVGGVTPPLFAEAVGNFVP